MHRKSSSHRHTKISLPLQLIGPTSIQRCRRHVESGDAVQGNAMLFASLDPSSSRYLMSLSQPPLGAKLIVASGLGQIRGGC
jgi:hypothetical protein